jgi:glutathione synthetase
MLPRQVLAQPGVTERFVDAKTASRIRSSYAGLYPLGDGSQEAAAAKARGIAQPDKYVLKPQREGGGNNLYDAEMKEGLEKMSDSELQAYILMDIIQAPRAPSLFMRDGELVETEAIAELGTYSTSIANGDKLVHNEYVGHLLRSKMANSKETGVAAGFGVIDSPYLYD